jgi:hypothetical protein
VRNTELACMQRNFVSRSIPSTYVLDKDSNQLFATTLEKPVARAVVACQ